MLPELIDITIATQQEQAVSRWFHSITVCADVLETRMNIATIRHIFTDLTIGVEAKFFTIEIMFSDKAGNIIDITHLALIDTANLFTHNNNLVFQNTGQMLSLRPENFALPVVFTLNIPGYQSKKFHFHQLVGEIFRWVIPMDAQQPVLIDRTGKLHINAQPDNPENNIII